MDGSMSKLEEKILNHAKLDSRFHANEQQENLGTLSERILLKITLDEMKNSDNIHLLPKIVSKVCEISENNLLFLKISQKVKLEHQIMLLKLSEKYNISSSVISDNLSHSPYGVVFHTDHALDSNKFPYDLEKFLCLFQLTNISNQSKKTSFFKKLFNFSKK